MINDPTVLVLGAGASVPYGFPSGRDLLLRISASLLGPNNPLATNLMKCGYAFDELLSFRNELYRSMQPSVDAFLENRREFIEIGKGAIAAELIPFENEGRLCSREKDERWYEYLFKEICPGPSEFKNCHLKVITFNYDRSFEHFLFVALRSTFGFRDIEAANFMKCIPIIHVHGQLGLLPYLNEKGRNFEPVVDPDSIRIAASQIKIAHETSPEDIEFMSAREMIQSAANVCFLGFGYHPANVQRLGFSEGFIRQHSDQRLMGSAYALMDAEKSRAENLFGGKIKLGLAVEDALAFLRRYPILG